jgi:hypothetical protein
LINQADVDTRIVDRNGLPLSFNQSSYLVLEWLGRLRGCAVETLRPVAFVAYFDGPLDVRALGGAINEVVRRHEVLRTAFPDLSRLTPRQKKVLADAVARRPVSGGGLFTQSVIESLSIPLEIERLPIDGSASAFSSLKARVHGELVAPFDYTVPPLVRARLFHVGPARHLLLVVFHHLVADRWSLQVVAQEIERLYNGAVTTRSFDALPALPMQYGDFARLQREQFRGPLGEDALSYGRQSSAFGRSLLKSEDLSVLGRTGEATAESRWERVALDPGTSQALRRLAQTQRVTTYMLCVTTLALLFSALSRKARVAWWGYYANRGSVESEALIGWFAQGCMLGVDIDVDEPVLDVLRRVRHLVCEAAAYQDIPLQVLWRALGAYQTAPPTLDDDFVRFNVVPRRPAVIELADGVLMSPAPGELTACEVGRALKLWAVDANGAPTELGCSYSSAWLAPSRVARLLDDWRGTLVRLAEQPEARVAALLPPAVC